MREPVYFYTANKPVLAGGLSMLLFYFIIRPCFSVVFDHIFMRQDLPYLKARRLLVSTSMYPVLTSCAAGAINII